MILDALGRKDEAREQYRRSIAADPRGAKAHYNLGVSLEAAGKAEEAKAEYERSIQLNPDSATAHNNLGKILAARGLREAALVQYDEALRLKADFPTALFNRALLLLSMPGREHDAAAGLEAVVRMQPDNTQAKKILADLRAQAR